MIFCCKQLPLRIQEGLSLELQKDFDNFDSSLLKIFVVRFYYAGNIWNRTVTDFDIVSVENLIEFVRLRRIFVEQ